MARNSVRRPMQIGIAVASWVASVSFVEAAVGADIARAVHRGEERIELRLRGLGDSAPRPLAPSSQPSIPTDELLEPWELVSV